MSELVTFGETALQLSPPGHERLATTRETRLHADGIESTAAVAANAVGGESTWVSQLPESPLGEQVVGQLHQHGIETNITWIDPDDTRQGLVFREFGSPPRESTVWQDRDQAAITSVNPGDLPMAQIQDAAGVFTGTSTAVLSEQTATTTEAMLRAASGSGVVTVLDLDYQPGLRPPERYQEVLPALLQHVGVFIATERHAKTVFDVSGQPREIAHGIAAETDIETVVITRDGRRAVALQDTPGTNVMHERRATETETVDSTGQEAAFAGVFLQRLIDGDKLEDALSYGVAAASLARTVPGPLLTADRDEVDHAVETVTEQSR